MRQIENGYWTPFPASQEAACLTPDAHAKPYWFCEPSKIRSQPTAGSLIHSLGATGLVLSVVLLPEQISR